MLRASIKSRPVYGKLSLRSGHAHLFVADAEGAHAILDLAGGVPPGFFESARIIYVPGRSAGTDLPERLRSLGAARYHEAPTITAMIPRLAQVLTTARMGLQVYLAGTEGLIGQAMRIASGHGIHHDAISTEHRGSEARRVQCVHCKGVTDNVTTQPMVCSHCGLNLLVRDHYSRRLSAFMGVCIDAEEPGSAPPPEEMFS